MSHLSASMFLVSEGCITISFYLGERTGHKAPTLFASYAVALVPTFAPGTLVI